MIKKKKILSLLLLCLFMSALNVSKVNAEDCMGCIVDINPAYGNSNTPSTGGNETPGTGGNGGDGNNNNGTGKWAEYPGALNGKKILYQYSVSVSGGFSYKVIGANLDGYANSNTIIKSGTWIGLNVHEEQRATWTVSNIQAKEVKKYFTCMKETRVCSREKERGYKPNGKWGDIYVWRCRTKLETVVNYEPHDYYDGYKCPPEANKTYISEKEEPIGVPGKVRDKVYSAARNAALGLVGAALSKVQITTDDVNEKNEHKTLIISAKLDQFIIPPPGPSGTIIKKYIYKPDNICMNLRTGKVSYNKECTKAEEVQLNPYNVYIFFYQILCLYQIKNKKDMKNKKYKH